MDQSRQRQYPEVRSNLNIVREIILISASLILWVICLMSFIVVLLSALGINNYYVLIIQSILKIESNFYGVIMQTALAVSALITVYLIAAYRSNKPQQKVKRDELVYEDN